jgi:hypothetical protein
MPIQGYTPNKSLVKIAQNSTDNWDVWQNQNLDALDEPVLVYNSAAAETLNSASVAVIKDDGTGAKKAYLATGAVYVLGDPLGVVMAQAQAGAPVRLALEGRVQDGAWSFGPSDKFVYLSNTGTVTATPTSVKLGYVLSSTAIYFIAPSVSGGQTDTVAGANGIQNTGDNINAVVAPTYGSAANTVCQGNDARLHGQDTDAGTSAASFEINYTANSARLLTTGLTANRDYTLPDGTTKLVGESVPSAITAQHSFAPASAQAPFALGANAQGQAVTGLNADQLDGNHAGAFATSGHDHAATYAPIANGVSNGDSHDHNGGDGAAIALATAAVSGTLPIANGGTGQATANTALNALIPSQAAAKGKVLLSDGSNTLWTPLPRKNFVTNGAGSVAQRVTGTDVLKNAAASTYVRGACDMFAGAWSGTACTAGSLNQDSSAAVGRTGYAHHFSGVTLAGTGVLYHRTRIESKDAKALKNQSASFQVKVLHDVGSNVNFTLYIRKPAVADNFTSVTEIANSGAIAVVSGTATTLSMENVSMGDCSNGIELEVVAAVGAITAKNLRLTEYQIEVGSVITDFEYESFQQTLLRCQRYLPALLSSSATQMLGSGLGQSATLAYLYINFPTTARVAPGGLTASNGAHITLHDGITGTASTAIALVWYSPGNAMISVTVASGLTQFRPYMAYLNNASAYLLFTGAEL